MNSNLCNYIVGMIEYRQLSIKQSDYKISGLITLLVDNSVVLSVGQPVVMAIETDYP